MKACNANSDFDAHCACEPVYVYSDIQTPIVCGIQINNRSTLLFHEYGNRGDKDCPSDVSPLSELHEKARLVRTEAVVNRANCVEISFLLVLADGTA